KNLRVSGPQFYGKSGGDGQRILNFDLPQDGIIKFMKGKKYKLIDADGKLIFIKNSFGKWGSAIFHSGLFLIIITAMAGLAFQKRGFVQVMEGEVFSGIHEDFLVRELGVFQRTFDAAFKSRLSKFSHEYWETDQVKSISSTVDLIDGNGTVYEETVTVNHPVKFKNVKIYQSFNYGYALSFIMKHQDGRETIAHFLLDHPDKKTKPFAGASDFPGTSYIFKMKFYPDISMNSFYPGRPILYLTVLKKASEVVFDGLIIPGNAVSVDGKLLRFFQILPWSGLIYVKSSGMLAAYIGFFISCLGAAVIFLFPYKEISISQRGSVLSLSGGTNRYSALFSEEVNAIGEELKDTVN
ncbi:MAG: cytochrome c biogenesis protein ResB, partial [Nitrospirae bacterium]|nr:cytochrome c biogenesis protein ResB [Nitrospirota bacterium]